MLSGMVTESVKVLRRINIIAGITLTLVVFCFLCCKKCFQQPQKPHVSVLFVTNLLISNLVLVCSFIPAELMPMGMGMGMGMGVLEIQIYTMVGFCFALMNSGILRMCIALERYMIIAHPTYIRGTLTSVLVCVGPWVFCFHILCFATQIPIIFHLSFLSPMILSIIFVVMTFVVLPAATSVAVEEKRRTAAVLVLLLVDYFLLIIPAFVLFIYSPEFVACLFLVLFTVFVDLTMSVLMFKGPIDKFLACLCYCMKDNATTDDRISPLVTDVGYR